MDFQYQHPEFFLALLAVLFAALLFGYAVQWKSAVLRKIGDPQLVKELISGYSPRKYLIKFLLMALALVSIIITVIDPWRPGKMDKVERKGVDVMIALDVSNSMLAQDIQPNRLEKAKQLVLRLMDQLKDDRVGLVVFAGRAYLQMPLTTDHGAARMYVQNAAPGMVPTQGTMIAEALRLSASAFNSKERKYKSIVLITDGEDHDASSVQVAEQLSENGIIVNTIGIGSDTGTPVPNPYTGEYRKDEAGNTVLSKLNEDQLKQLAAVTRGVYIGPGDIPEANAILSKKLATIQETAIEDAAFKDYIHYFQWFAALALILLVAEFFLPERTRKRNPVPAKITDSNHRQLVSGT